jgi:histone arginine demethylase JMJD6
MKSEMFEESILKGHRIHKKKQNNKSESKILKAKKSVRSHIKIDNWGKDQYWNTSVCEDLYKSCEDTIERRSYKDFSISEFIEQYQVPNKPVMITGAIQAWKSEKFWDWDEFYKRFKKVKFRIGEDDEENDIRIKLKNYYEYMLKNKDDSPLYLFEKDIADKKIYKPILNGYSVPKYFKDDLFDLMKNSRRPPHQWFLIGPKRSGTSIHIDPLNTSAWNTSIHGYKLWILFPNEIPKWIANGKQFVRPSEETEAIDYFSKQLPRIKQSEGKTNLKYIECIQRPGETIFVPGGWWHAVLNLTHTMAVTQNYCSHYNFDYVWKSFRISRKVLSQQFLEILRSRREYLYDRAVDLNKRDNFQMRGKSKKSNKKGSNKKKVENKRKESNTTTTLFSSSSATTSSSSSSDSEENSS